jgi:cysteine-S-conjugate beta-lyase
VPERGAAGSAAGETDPFDDVSLELLRSRRSAKWTRYEPDVLPAFVAEMDFALALPIREVLQTAIARDDTGYAMPGRLAEAFTGFAAERFGWQVDPAGVRLVADVVSGVGELLRALTEPGDGVVVSPPVYPPFFSVTKTTGRRVVEAPLQAGADGWRLDLDALERAFADGARVYLLCHPHNPTGTSFCRGELEAVAALAAEHGVTVISDEVHAPLTMTGAVHLPYLSLGGAAAEHGIALSSASKSWNIAGLKCALIVASSERQQARLAERLPEHLGAHAGHLGVLASVAAFEHGSAWLDALLGHLDRNRRALGELLAEHLPQVRYLPPQAGYLAWLDCRALGLGDDPAAVFLERGRVALSPGPLFGEPGNGFARLNFGTSSALLELAVRRIAASIATR